MANQESPGERLLHAHRALRKVPFGDFLFTRMVKQMIPYTGSVNPRVEVLEPGYARISIVQKRRLEQHLGSIHAIALMNVAEFASGAAMTTALPAGYRGIVTKMSIEYFKKARGKVTAESRPELPDLTVEGEYDFYSTITDAAGDMVARATVRWKLGPIPQRSAAESAAGTQRASELEKAGRDEEALEAGMRGTEGMQ